MQSNKCFTGLNKMQSNKCFARDIAVIGGCGHVGLPLALMLAHSGLRTVIYDINSEVVEQVRQGKMPFTEEGAPEMLRHVLERETLEVHATPELLGECEFLMLIIGTPV